MKLKFKSTQILFYANRECVGITSTADYKCNQWRFQTRRAPLVLITDHTYLMHLVLITDYTYPIHMFVLLIRELRTW